ERIRKPVADFQIAVILRETLRRKLDCGDDLVRLQIVVELRRIAGQAVEVGKRNCALTRGSRHMNLCFESSQRDAHVGWMRCDARLARSEDRVDPVDASD